MGLFNLFRQSTDMNAGIAEYKSTDGAILLDVRTTEEYDDGHVEGSINVPLNKMPSIETIIKDKATPLYVHCYSGSRSGQAVSYLKKIGYTHVKNIGGISTYHGKVVK